MSEASYLGIKWPQWHTLMLEGQEKGGHEGGLPAGCNENASETSQSGLLEKVAAEHECEELKRVWLGSIQAALRRTVVKCGQTKHHDVT